MSYPEGTVSVLGVPYRLEYVDLPDPDEYGCDRMIDRDQGVLLLQNQTSTEYAKRGVFWFLIREAAQLLAPNHPLDFKAEAAFSNVFYGLLRTNPEVLAFCAGWSDKLPPGVNVAGTFWVIQRVDHCPGCDKSIFGLTIYRDCAIYLRSELPIPLQRAALLHELGHAVGDEAAESLRDDEAFLKVAHTTIAAVLRDNPDFMRSLFDYQGADANGGP